MGGPSSLRGHLALGTAVCFFWLILGQTAWAEDKPKAIDRYGDPLPEGAVARLGTVRFRHDGTANGITYSPDGKILAASCSGKIILWEAATGKKIRQLPIGSAGWLSRHVLDFSPDGKTLVVVHAEPLTTSGIEKFRNEISFWDVASGRYVRSIKPKLIAISSSLRFAPDGKTLALTAGSHLCLVDATTGEERWKKALPDWFVPDVAFAPDGKTLAILVNHPANVQLWDATSGKLIRSLDHPKNDDLAAIAYSHDGKTIATASKDAIYLWEAASGKEIGRLDAKIGWSNGLAFTPDGKTLVSGNSDAQLVVWDLDNRRLRFTLGTPLTSGGASLALSPDGKTAALGTYYSTIHLFDLATGKELHSEFEGLDRWVRCLAFSPDGSELLAGGDNRKIYFWDLKTGKAARTLDANAQTLSLAPDGKYLAAVPFALTHFATHSSGGPTDAFHVWDLSAKRRTATASDKETSWASYSPDGKTLVSLSGSRLLVWEPDGGKQLAQHDLPRSVSPVGFLGDRPCRPLLFDGKTLFVATTRGGGIRDSRSFIHTIDLASGKEKVAISAGSEFNGAVAASADGKILASGAWELSLWDLAKGKRLHSLGRQQRLVQVLAFSADGRYLASAAGYPQHQGDVPDLPGIRIWDVAKGEELIRYETDGGFVGSLAFTANGTQLVSGMYNGSILIWKVPKLPER